MINSKVKTFSSHYVFSSSQASGSCEGNEKIRKNIGCDYNNNQDVDASPSTSVNDNNS